MKIVFFILWLISVLVWLIYFIKTCIALKQNTDYMEQSLKTLICSCFVMLFNALMKIF